GLISDVLDFSRIEAGHLVLDEGAFELGQVLDASIRMLEPRAEKAGVEIHENLETNFLLHGDERRVRQIILNLGSNAVKFTRPGGRIDIEAVLDPDGNIVIEVRDTGVGIAACDLDRVMQVFGQVDNYMSRSNEGTGLGLPLTKRLVEAMGGSIELASEVGV